VVGADWAGARWEAQVFFFEKKKQKTFARLGCYGLAAVA
jgi:hypothetical protein